MSCRKRFERAASSQASRKEDRPLIFSGLLGITTMGEAQVEVPARDGFVWVRLRNQLNELIQAWNPSVSPVYDLPVMVQWDQLSPNRYTIMGRDSGRYPDWGSVSTYEPKHGWQHSFNPAIGDAGGDITWVYSQQFMPFLATPSGSSGAMSVSFQPYVYYYDNAFEYAGATGLEIASTLKPTGTTTARMLLIYLDEPTGNFLIATGSLTEFDATWTGTADVLPYLPPIIESNDIPIAGVRLVTGTATMQWANLYDVRLWHNAGTRIEKHVDIPAGTFRLGASAPTQGTEGTFATLLFADNVTNEAYFNFHVSEDWAIGTDLEFAIYWAPTSAGTGTVAWEFDWETRTANTNEALGAGSTHVDIHDQAEALDNELLQTIDGGVSGAGLVKGDAIGLKIYRDHDDAADDYSGNAAMIHLGIHYTADRDF